jgi:hypothetical protein
MAFHFVPTGEFPFCPCCPFLVGNSLSLPWRRLQREFLCPNGRSSDSTFMLVDRKGVALCASISRPLRELWRSTKLRFVQIPAFHKIFAPFDLAPQNGQESSPDFEHQQQSSDSPPINLLASHPDGPFLYNLTSKSSSFTICFNVMNVE